MAAFAAVYVIWGSTYLGIRFAVESIPPFLMAGTRNLAAGLLLYALRARPRRRGAIARRMARRRHHRRFDAGARQRRCDLGGTGHPFQR